MSSLLILGTCNDIVVPSNTREPRDEEVESAVKFAEARTLK
jgi:hypothetical protein